VEGREGRAKEGEKGGEGKARGGRRRKGEGRVSPQT